jgi:L-alanine-DL-glutamate epimerase-like enolase superfamily enzyme
MSIPSIPKASRAGWTVTRARAEIRRAPLVTPFRIATGAHANLENVFFRIELADGSVGWGEAGVAPHITGETVAGTLRDLRSAARALLGQELSDYRAVCASFRPTFHASPAGLAAFEMAVLDAVARSCGFPFWRWFGQRPARCRTDITVVIGSVREAGAMARRFYRRGFRSFKIKIGTDPDLDLARILAVARHAAGALLLLDGNQGFSADAMLGLLRALRRAGVRPRLLEQPVPRDDWDGLARLTRESGVQVCVDESARTLADAVRVVRSRAAGVVNVKFAKCGVLEAFEIARFVRASGLRLMIGAMMESALAISAAAHFAAGWGGFDYVDLDTTYFLEGPLGKSPFLDGAGRFEFHGAPPGIGVEP